MGAWEDLCGEKHKPGPHGPSSKGTFISGFSDGASWIDVFVKVLSRRVQLSNHLEIIMVNRHCTI